MKHMDSTMDTLVSDIVIALNGLAPTTYKYCDFKATLTCSVKDETATGNVRK